jgi:simple sugar transport system ATP-binding protein
MSELTEPNVDQSPLLRMEGVCKRFSDVIANENIDFEIYKSEIHALLGENGAGKSTLMKILYGYYKSDKGKIFLEGKETKIRSPHDAMQLNIGMVFQVLNLIPAITVLENIALFLKELPFVYSHAQLRKQILDLSKQYSLEVNPDNLVSHLSIGEQQKVEILKLLLSEAKVLILDEPTRVLAPHEVEGLFDVLNKLKKDGYAIVLITHKLNEVLESADRITVLRGGKVAGSILHKEASETRLIQMMFDKQLTTRIVRQDTPRSEKPVLELISFSTQADGASISLKNLELKIFPGEIVGVAGVSGNGQKELCDAILGMEKIVSGKKLLDGKNFTHASTGLMRKFGMGFIPENPLTMATVPFMSVLENMAITRSEYYSKSGGFGMDWKLVREDTKKSLEKFGFTFSYYIPAKSLSGGNLQRLIIARELMKDPKLIIASYLTRGLDVQSTLVARQELMQARNSGTGVLLISEDLDELFSLSDRLIVLYEGKIVGEFIPTETDIYHIGHLMTGSKETYDSKS